MRRKTFFIKTFGCQMNKSDSERIAGCYLARGFKEIKDWKKADEIVINTCAVRQRAEDRVTGFLYNLEQGETLKGGAKRRAHDAVSSFKETPLHFSRRQGVVLETIINKPKIILTGCMLHFSASKILEMFPSVDEVLPIGEVGFNSPAIRRDKNHAFVPVSSGCNSFCTYCIVPYSRGREVSRPKDEIIKEVKELILKGYTEITLLGQNVNSYGLEKQNIVDRKKIYTNQSQYKKPSGFVPFVDLIKHISSYPQIKKLSFFTSNPWDFYDELIDEIAVNPKIDRFIHLPVQSGSDKILKLMNRGYTSADYLRLVEKIKTKITDATLGTDIIVGFPGETEADFQATVDLAKQVDWHIAFVAQYSPRPGTLAEKLYPDDVVPAEKKRRFKILEDLINQKHLSHRPEIK